MKKVMVLAATVVMALGVASTATAANDNDGWKDFGINKGETCFNKYDRKVKMHTLNGEMRKTQCFTLQRNSETKSYRAVSRDGTVVKTVTRGRV